MTGLGLSRHRHLPTLALLAVALVCAWPLAARPGALATAITIGMFSAVAVPLGLIYGQGGILSLAQGTFAALGAYAAGILATKTGVSPWVSLVAAAVLPAALAAALARPILRLPPLALVIATLAFATIVEEVLVVAGPITGGRVGLTGVQPLEGIGTGIGAYLLIWGFVALLVFGYVNLKAGSHGRALNAIRVDPTLARSAGVWVAAESTLVFTLAAATAGMAGWFYVHYVGFIAPESLSFHYSSAVLLMVIIGGRNAVLGPVVGAVFYVLVQDLLPTGHAQLLIFGLLLALTLVLLPNGLASLPAALRHGRPAAAPEQTASAPEASVAVAQRQSS